MTNRSSVEVEYQSRMAALSGTDRVARSMAMLQWTREMPARQILAEKGPMSDERLKWETALRLYGADPTTRKMIERKLATSSATLAARHFAQAELSLRMQLSQAASFNATASKFA